MDSEKILFCYRDDKVKKAFAYDKTDNNKIVAGIRCIGKIGRKEYLRSIKKIKNEIAKIYQDVGANKLWLDGELCDCLKMQRMDWPESMLKEWLSSLPQFHTLIFADDKTGKAADVLEETAEKLAAAAVVCYENNLPHYERIAANLYQREGIVLQIYTYENLKKEKEDFSTYFTAKGRTALLDLEDNRVFWEKRLSKGIAYYSFEAHNRLFLDTCRKNSYNTLTK